MPHSLFRPSYEPKSPSTKDDEDDGVAKKKQIALAKEHTHAHASECDEGGIAECYNCNDGGFEHATSASGRMEVDGDGGNNMFAILLAKEGRNEGDKSGKRA